MSEAAEYYFFGLISFFKPPECETVNQHISLE